MDVIFFEAFQEEAAAIKKFLPSDITAGYDSRTIQDCQLKEVPASVISIRTQSRIPTEWAGKLKGILARSQGYDHLTSYRQTTQSNVPCGYLGDYCSRAVAEHAIMAMMTLLRKLKTQVKNFDTFVRDGITGFECRNRNALVIGVGNIGGEIINIVKGLQMKVKGVDIKPTKNDIEYVPISEGVRWADVVFCSLPLTDQTNAMLDYELWKDSGREKFLINISRGEITPIADLDRLLREGVLAGMSLDVFPDEDRFADFLRGSTGGQDQNMELLLSLSKNDNVLFTPHNAFNSEEAVTNKARLSAEAIAAFLKNNKFPVSIPFGSRGRGSPLPAH